MGFPFQETALMTLSVLTFAVFLIKLVLVSNIPNISDKVSSADCKLEHKPNTLFKLFVP